MALLVREQMLTKKISLEESGIFSHVPGHQASDVVPVFKKESMTDKTCYRPVSVLTSLSKLYEKVLFDQIYEVDVLVRLYNS